MNNDIARARSIFISAVEDCAPGQWDKFLDDACREDVALRQRVELLLRAHQGEDSFLDRGNDDGAGTTIDRPIAERPGMVIGPYKLLQQIGEGGFGVVFLAEQERPVKRRVALKVIKPGMDTREVIARFEAERQALALMDHPNIAKVLDAGTTGGGSRDKGQGPNAENSSSLALDSRLSTLDHPGRPYFVMELVQGVPITEYCDKCNLTTRERLSLFVTVCQAVQHAHQKGVIHRDIKPTNVLVAIQDGRPSPKIIDFGVAKAINQQLTEHTLMTAFAQIVGTPLYMSPEQAELSPLGVDTRSDIYSLGVLLYELLTSTTPFDKERLQAASYDELRRIIREEEPPPPSARLSTLAADRAATVAEHRRTDTRRLRQAVRGELDWIVMKCLEKDRNRRYETPNSLARDVERYLNDEPVQACPPSTVYRFRKFARRNKTLLAAGGAISAALFLGLGLATWQYFRATTESARAHAVSELMREMLSSADKSQAKGDQYTVRELLDDFSAGLGNQLADQPAAAADIHDTIGGAYSMLDLPTKAEPHLKKVIELRQRVDGPEDEKVATAIVSYAWILHDQKRYIEAENQLHKALEIYRRRGVPGRRLIHAMSALQKVLLTLGRKDEAKRVMDEAKAIADRSEDGYYDVATMLMRHANLKNSQGEFAEAEQLARQSIEMQRALPDKHALTGAHGLLTLSIALQSQQKLEEAEQAARECLAIFRGRYAPDHANVRRATDQLKSILTSRGDKPALESLAKAEVEEESRSDSPGYHLRLAELLLTNHSQGSATNDVAHQLIWRAIEEYGQVAVDSPEDMDRRLKAVEGYVEIAKLCAADPDFAPEIDELNRRLTAEFDVLTAAFGESVGNQIDLAHSYRRWAFAIRQNETYLPQVEYAYRESIELFDRVLRGDRAIPHTRFFLANTYVFLGDVLWRSSRPEDAGDAFRRAMEIYDQHAAEIAKDLAPANISESIHDYACIAYYLVATHREEEAAEFVEKAALTAEGLTDLNASADGLYYTALAQLRLGDEAGYRATCKALTALPLGTLEGLTKSRPIWTPCLAPNALDDPTLPVKLGEEFVANSSIGESHFRAYVVGAAHYRAGQYAQAAKQFEESIAAFPSGSLPVTDSMNYHQLFLAMTKWQLGQKHQARQLLAETLPDVQKELESPASGWNRRATLELLRGEAEALIEQKEAEEAVENNGRNDE